jgi:type I restriction enzyme S subunit
MSSGLALKMQRVHGGKWKRYPAYKDSGVGWLGDVPEHWGVNRLKFLFQFLDNCRIPVAAEDRAVMAKIYPYYGASGIIDHVEDYIFDESLILVAEDGANLLSRSTPLAFIANGKYWVNNHAHILRPISGQIIFWEGVLQTYEYEPLVTGAAQPKLTKENLGSILLPRPTVEEQRAIAAFLDRETGRIDALIAKKARQIELLRAKRTALISHAVTKGLDPDVEMKDSGVEWIGAVPVGWDIFRAKFVFSIPNGQVDPKSRKYRNLTLIAPNHVDSGTGKIIYAESAEEQQAESGKYTFCKGDVLYSKIRPHLRKACLPEIKYGLCSADMYPLRPKKTTNSRYLLYALLSDYFTNFAVNESMRVAMPKINREDLSDCYFALPKFEEQHAIATLLDRETGCIDALTAKVRESITKLREYRTALISAAVTGKIDVRGELVS